MQKVLRMKSQCEGFSLLSTHNFLYSIHKIFMELVVLTLKVK